MLAHMYNIQKWVLNPECFRSSSCSTEKLLEFQNIMYQVFFLQIGSYEYTDPIVYGINIIRFAHVVAIHLYTIRLSYIFYAWPKFGWVECNSSVQEFVGSNCTVGTYDLHRSEPNLSICWHSYYPSCIKNCRQQY